MKTHYRLNDEEYEKLLANGITIADLIKERKKFRVSNDKDEREYQVSGMMLLYYFEEYGNWDKGFESKHKIIARAVFNSLESKEKIEIMKYMALTEGEEIEEDEVEEYEVPKKFNWRK